MEEDWARHLVTDSAQLLSLLRLGPGGKIVFKSDGGAIDINGARMTAGSWRD
jgi:hypothetical protein